MATKKTKRTGGGEAGAEPVGAIPVLYRVTREHRDALVHAALRMRDERGGAGRANASAVLRALLDEWIEKGAKVP